MLEWVTALFNSRRGGLTATVAKSVKYNQPGELSCHISV